MIIFDFYIGKEFLISLGHPFDEPVNDTLIQEMERKRSGIFKITREVEHWFKSRDNRWSSPTYIIVLGKRIET